MRHDHPPPLFAPPTPARFDGPGITVADAARLTGQMARISELMADGCWRTLGEIEAATGAPQASVSARLRDLRKTRFGGSVVERRRRTAGTWEYRVGGGA